RRWRRLPYTTLFRSKDRTEPVAAMPGVARRSPDLAVQEARRAFAAGVPAVILFGLPAAKDPEGSEAWNPYGPVQEAVARIKDARSEEHTSELQSREN